jgi:dephospho-CoA kinase
MTDELAGAASDGRPTREAPAARGVRVGLTGGLASGKSTVARRLAAAGCTVVDADRLVAALYRPGEAGVEAVRELFGEDVLATDGGVDVRRLGALVFADGDARRRLEAAIHPLVRVRFAAIAAAAASGELATSPLRAATLTSAAANGGRAAGPVAGAAFPAGDGPATGAAAGGPALPVPGATPAAAPPGPDPDLARVVVLEATLLVEAGYAPDFDLVVTVEADPAIRLARAVARGMDEADARARLLAQGEGEARRAAAQVVLRNDGDPAALAAAVDALLGELRRRLAITETPPMA